MRRGRNLRFEHRQQLAHGVGDFDGVRARLPHDLQHDRALDPRLTARVFGVEPVAVEHVFDAVDDIGDLLETDRRTPAVGDHHRPERGGVHQLPCGLDVVGRRRAEQLPGRQVDVPVRQRLIDLVDADPFGMQLVGIELDADRVLRCALHLHLRYAVHHRDARRDQRFCVIVEHRQRQRVRREINRDDRLVVRVVLAE